MKRGTIPDEIPPAAERLRIVVDRQLNLADNKQGHGPMPRARMMQDNEFVCAAIFSEAWGSPLT